MPGIISFGEFLVDMVSDANVSLGDARSFLKAPGGAPANVAVGARRLGVSARFVGQVGADAFGDWLLEIMETEGVDSKYLLQTTQARTTIAFVASRHDGKKDICFYRNPGADMLLASDAIDGGLFSDELFDDAQVFHCGSLSLSQNPCREAQFKAVRMARERGVLVSFDPNWRSSIWSDLQVAHDLIWEMMRLSDVVKVAEEEWEFITGTSDLEKGAQKIRAAGPQLVVVTRGEKSAYFNCRSTCGYVDGFVVESVDTLGAGDAFVAGLLARLLEYSALEAALENATLKQIVRFANACGALATTKSGAIPALPSRSEVDAFLKNNSL